jgi:NAD(P)-binding Rossmann-like domain
MNPLPTTDAPPHSDPSITNGHTSSLQKEIPDADPMFGVIENFRTMRVIVIGAGFSGIYCGVRIPERLRNVELAIYEKNAGVGGTWYENRYPGCACDVPGNRDTKARRPPRC